MPQRQQRQANVRIDDELFEQIEVTAFVHRRTFADEMRAALVAWAERYREDPLVKQASGSREATPATVPEEANVTHLNPKGRRGKT